MNDTVQVDAPKSPRKSRRVAPPKPTDEVQSNAPPSVTIGAPGRVPALDDEIPATPLTDDGDGELANISPEEMDEALESADLDLEPNTEVNAWISTAQKHGAGAPARIEIRELGVGRADHTQHLRPLRGYIDLDDVTKAGSLERAVAVKMNHKPGTYVVQFVDPIGKRRIGDARYVKVAAPEATPDIKSLDETIAKTRKRVTLAEAEAELETARADLEAVRGGASAALLEEVRRLRADVASIRQAPPAQPTEPSWFEKASKLLAIPLVGNLLERLLKPAPLANTIDSIGPMMQKVMEISMSAHASHQEALRERENMVLEQMMKMMAKQAGIQPDAEPEEESLIGIAGKVIDMMKASQAAGAPARVPAVVASPATPAAPKPVTPFVQFVHRLLACAQKGTTPLAAAAAVTPAWRALPDHARHALATGHQDSLAVLFDELEEDVYATVGGALGNERFLAWYGEVIKTLAGAASPAATVSEPAAAQG